MNKQGKHATYKFGLTRGGKQSLQGNRVGRQCDSRSQCCFAVDAFVVTFLTCHHGRNKPSKNGHGRMLQQLVDRHHTWNRLTIVATATCGRNAGYLLPPMSCASKKYSSIVYRTLD
jgi:hypothetical protein